MNCLCGASIKPQWPACLVCKRPIEGLDPAEEAAPLTPDLTREDRCQEVLPPEAKARRFKVTLRSGGVLLHSAPSGLTRREAIELSRDWGEMAECVPVFTPLEVSKPVPLDLALAAATAGLPITAEQFRIDLSQDDLADLAARLIPVECLRAYAERFSKRITPQR